MVYTERTEKCSSPKDNNNNVNNKTTSVANKYAQQSNSSGSTAWSSKASNEEKWKYNNMVKNDRQKFNSLHFC